MGNPKRDLHSLIRNKDQSHPQFVNAVARAFSILRCFDENKAYLGNQEIAKRTGLPKPTVSRLTFTLSSLGYLSYSPALEKYSLGTGVVTLGRAFLKNNNLIDVARPLMQELAEYTRSAVMLAEADGMRMVLLEICQGDPTFQLKLQVGSRVPHGTTALGRADLAARSPEQFETRLAVLQRGCEPALWDSTREGIVRARQDYAKYGFCFSLGDWNPDVYAVGVPIVAEDESRVLAFNCSGRVTTVTREKLLQDFGPRLVALRNTVYERTQGRF